MNLPSQNRHHRDENRASSLFGPFAATGLAVILDLLLPAAGLARWPAGTETRVQPALVLALTLTSLVLFLIYLFQKKKSGPAPFSGSGIGETDPHAVVRETDRFMERLFDQNIFPMAKFNLDTGEILDATAPLFKTLGYKKEEILNLSSVDLGLMPKASTAADQLRSQGWQDTDACLAGPATGCTVDCRILNTLTDSGRIVISIVSGMEVHADAAPAPSPPIKDAAAQ